MSNSEEQEDIVAKYKRLLALARSSLEANQASLSQKDKQISQLMQTLEEERSQKSRKQSAREDESQRVPRALLRRIDVDHTIWVLMAFDGEDSWISFTNEQELDDYIQRVSGMPLAKPQRCLTMEESAAIEAESKRKVERIVEEFRRFKVRMEISRKQRDADARQASQILNEKNVLSEMTSADGQLGGGTEEMKWRQAYERLAAENEQLRTRGGESLLLAQWKERYESCLKEKEELAEKLRIYSRLSTAGSHGGSSSGAITTKSLEQLYCDLKDEYREYRRRSESLDAQRKSELEELRHSLLQASGSGDTRLALASPLSSNNSTNNSIGIGTSGGLQDMAGPVSSKLNEAKMQYIRHMVLQYLVCRDPLVKPHIESALVAIFRFSDAERQSIAERQKEELEAQDSLLPSSLTSLTNLLAGFG